MLVYVYIYIIQMHNRIGCLVIGKTNVQMFNCREKQLEWVPCVILEKMAPWSHFGISLHKNPVQAITIYIYKTKYVTIYIRLTTYL